MNACLAILAVGMLAASATAAPKRSKAPAPAKSKAPSNCFELGYGTESAAARKVFKARNKQGGGPTWAGIVEVVLRQRATVGDELEDAVPDAPGFGIPRAIEFQGKRSWFVLDDEGDGAIFCSGDAALRAVVASEYQRLNADPKALDAVLAQARPGELE